MKSLFFLLTAFILGSAFADSSFIDRKKITNKPFINCTNGGTIQLVDTRYGNVKKILFTKEHTLTQYSYVRFYTMTDHYVGDVIPSKTFSDPLSGEDSVEGKIYAELTIDYDGKGLILTVDPVKSKDRDNAYSCRNY